MHMHERRAAPFMHVFEWRPPSRPQITEDIDFCSFGHLRTPLRASLVLHLGSHGRPLSRTSDIMDRISRAGGRRMHGAGDMYEETHMLMPAIHHVFGRLRWGDGTSFENFQTLVREISENFGVHFGPQHAAFCLFFA